MAPSREAYAALPVTMLEGIHLPSALPPGRSHIESRCKKEKAKMESRRWHENRGLLLAFPLSRKSLVPNSSDQAEGIVFIGALCAGQNTTASSHVDARLASLRHYYL